MARTPQKPSETISDNRKDRRSVVVPDEIWAHVENYAKDNDMSEAAVVRHCITHAIISDQFDRIIMSKMASYFELASTIGKHYCDLGSHIDDISKNDPTLKVKADRLVEHINQLAKTLENTWNELHRITPKHLKTSP